MTGYDPERKYDVQLFAGIVASMRLKTGQPFFLVGGEAGLQTSYQVSRRFKVFLEPKIRFYGKELLMQDNVQGRDVMMSLHAGTSSLFLIKRLGFYIQLYRLNHILRFQNSIQIFFERMLCSNTSS